MKKLLVIPSSLFILLLFVAGCSSGLPSASESEETALTIARCIKEKGIKMYGAFWCPHCAEQKRIFGKKAEAEMPYYECDPRGENSVTDQCLQLKIEKYPTWIFADGTRVTGVLSLKDLSEKTGCDEAPAAS